MSIEAKSEQKMEYFPGNNWGLPTDLSLVPEAADELERRLAEAGWPEDSINSTSTAFREVLINAMVHGNLELSDKSKINENEKWDELVKRLSIKTDKKVFIELKIAPEEVVIKVRDEGEGFDPDEALDTTSPERLLKPTGRGLTFMKLYFDEVSFDRENKTVILKKVRD